MVLTDAEARKLQEQKEQKEFQLQLAKERVFPNDQKRKAPVEDSESDNGESEDEQSHGKVPCDACHEIELVCKWSGTRHIKVCD
jgi:hypothetical protein